MVVEQYDYIIRKSGANTIAYNTSTDSDEFSSSDARTTFQNVVCSLNSAGGGSCLVKKGTYTMVNVNDKIDMKDNQNWVGEDRDLTILVNQSTTQATWKRITTPLIEFKMSNMTLSSAGAGNMIYCSGSLDCTFENMYFIYTSEPPSGTIMTFFDSVNGTMDNRRLTIRNCKYEGETKGQDMLGCGNMYGCGISHNAFMSGDGQGMGINTAIGSKFNDNYFYNVGTNPIGFEAECDGNTVNGNICISCGGQIKLSELGTAVNKSINNICCNNIMEYCNGGGIEDGIGRGDIICNNVFKRLRTYGIRGTLSASIISGNVFYDINTSNSNTIINGTYKTGGIVLSNNSNFTSPKRCSINNNYFYNSKTDFTVPTGYIDAGQIKRGYGGGILIDTNNKSNISIDSSNIFDGTYNTIVNKGSK